jgi:DegV family protein with EDD domain
MAKIRIVTDSTSDIPISLREELGIKVVPLKIHFGEETFLDGETITSTAFYEKLVASEQLPTTSTPAPMDFVQVYESILEEEGQGVEIISIHLAGVLSGTLQTANLAASMVEDKVKVHVLDSKLASYAFGQVVVALARAAREGKTVEECLELARLIKENTHVLFVVDTLAYLQKGGRIGKAAAFLGTLLNVKPILTLDENGTVSPVEKMRGKKKAIQHIFEASKKYAGTDPVVVSVLHSANEKEAEAVAEQIREQVNIQELVLTEIGPVIGTYTGPGVVGIVMYKL